MRTIENRDTSNGRAADDERVYGSTADALVGMRLELDAMRNYTVSYRTELHRTAFRGAWG